jgi:hypothetical protein
MRPTLPLQQGRVKQAYRKDTIQESGFGIQGKENKEQDWGFRIQENPLMVLP